MDVRQACQPCFEVPVRREPVDVRKRCSLAQHCSVLDMFFAVRLSMRCPAQDLAKRAQYAAAGDMIHVDRWRLSGEERVHLALCGVSLPSAKIALTVPGRRAFLCDDALSALEIAAEDWGSGWFELLWGHGFRMDQGRFAVLCRRLILLKSGREEALEYVLARCPVADYTDCPFAEMIATRWYSVRNASLRLKMTRLLLQHVGLRAFLKPGSFRCNTLEYALYDGDEDTTVLQAPSRCLDCGRAGTRSCTWRPSRR